MSFGFGFIEWASPFNVCLSKGVAFNQGCMWEGKKNLKFFVGDERGNSIAILLLSVCIALFYTGSWLLNWSWLACLNFVLESEKSRQKDTVNMDVFHQ
ncbi:hypothetical protein VNO78_03426 [Psophocarpus tetragonolobus]|uniref:Uncharacterized protein n=1 Tax=Psophocarpus tetragonolobus TaxID=3891 RepID=A0AAN9T0I1_PSOTE